MKIGIDGSRAFKKKRTGIEEYSYQVIKNLREDLKGTQVVLYIRKNQDIDFSIPNNWRIKVIRWPRLWTQVGLSIEMLLNPIDVLFIPAHTVPLVHPKKTVVTIHGLEYEFCPKAYSFWERIYMRWSIKNSCKWASRIISVSENTKKDLVKLYDVPEKRVEVVYEGYDNNPKIKNQKSKKAIQELSPYLLFIGRLEERKNIIGIISAFEILKERYNIPYKLVLAGGKGYGYGRIVRKIESSKFKGDIVLPGFVSEDEKWDYYEDASVFIFPTLYEGFGLPVLEAQSVRLPVVISNAASLPEIFGSSSLMVDPENYDEISEAVYKLISDEELRNSKIMKGYENVKRFSWKKCSNEVGRILMES